MAVCAPPPPVRYAPRVTEHVLLYVESTIKNNAHVSGFAHYALGGTNRKNPKNVKKARFKSQKIKNGSTKELHREEKLARECNYSLWV